MLSDSVQSIISQTPCNCIQISRHPSSIPSMLHTVHPISLIQPLRYLWFIVTDSVFLLNTLSHVCLYTLDFIGSNCTVKCIHSSIQDLMYAKGMQSIISQTLYSCIQISGRPERFSTMLCTSFKPHNTSQIGFIVSDCLYIPFSISDVSV